MSIALQKFHLDSEVAVDLRATVSLLNQHRFSRWIPLREGVAFFQFESTLKKDKYLFSINESARARRYINMVNPFETAFAFVVAGAVVVSLVIFCWHNPVIINAILSLLKQASFTGVFMAVCALVAFSIVFIYPRSYTHICFAHHLRLHRSYMSRGQPYRWVIAKDIEHLILKEIRYREESFIMVEVIFKPFGLKFLGKPWSARFGISDLKALNNFRSWANTHGIAITEKYASIVA